MKAVEFIANVNNGVIEIPNEYRKDFNSSLKVILLKQEEQVSASKTGKKILYGFGVLSHKANPDLWEQEEGAWERAAKENYENN